ncbi:MAG: TorF family putative porin [Woeseiaceae bacterium]
MYRCRLLFVFVTIPGFVAPAVAEGLDLSYDVAASTDYMFRGVSQTGSDPALQASVSVDTDNGWYGYLWASNVDYVQPPEPDDGVRSELNIFIGHNWTVSERLQADLAWVRYVTPSAHEDMDYDEWFGTVTLDDRHALTVTYSDDVYGSGAPSWHYLAATSFDLPAEVTLELHVGSVDLRDAYGESYEYGGASLVRSFGVLTAKLDYLQTSSNAKRVSEESLIKPRVVLTVGLNFE